MGVWPALEHKGSGSGRVPVAQTPAGFVLCDRVEMDPFKELKLRVHGVDPGQQEGTCFLT